MAPKTLSEFLIELTSGALTATLVGEAGHQAACRVAAGETVEVDEETFDWFVDVLPPRYFERGVFAFAEGEEPYRLFWRKQQRYFVRRLSWDETRLFQRLQRRSP